MAPGTRGLNLFNLSSKKDKSKSKSSVEGAMVLKQADSKKAAAEPAKIVEQPAKKPESKPEPIKAPVAADAKKEVAPVKKEEPRPVEGPIKVPTSLPAAPTTAAAAKEQPAKATPAPVAADAKKEAAPVKKEETKPAEAPIKASPAAPAPAAAKAEEPRGSLAMPLAAEAAAKAAEKAAAAKEQAVKEQAAKELAAKELAAKQQAAKEAAAKELAAREMAAAKEKEVAAAKEAEAAREAAAAAAAKEVAAAAAREAAAQEAAAAAAKEAAAAAAKPLSLSSLASNLTNGKTKKSPVTPPAVQPVPMPEPINKMRADDARAAWQTRPRVPVRLLDSYVNFMVCGESGLGKTTFINNLVSSYVVNSTTHDGSSTSLADFQSDPESLKTVLEPMEVREAGRRLHVSVQDMPGWADDINLVRYLRIMVNFILQQRAKDYEMLAGGRALNESAMCGQLKNSITSCIYFLTPHRVKKVDLIMMSALSQLVTVIPVIAKADTMTDDELAQFREEIRTRLAAPFKFVHSKTLAPLDFNQFAFDESVLSALGLKDEKWPLAIITSNKHEMVEDAGLLVSLGLSGDNVEQPVRAYKWGQAYALNREHSDLIILKRLLLGDRVDSLYAMLDESYNRYVAFCEQYEEAGKQLPLIVQDELACSAYLEYDDYSNAKSALDAAQQAMSTLMAENKVLVERLNALEKEKGASVGGIRFKSSNSANAGY